MKNSSPSASTTILLILVFGVSCLASAIGQDKPSAPQLPAPPPLRAISPEERRQLESGRDEKARIRQTIEFLSLRLQRAQQLTSQQKYDETLLELGVYLALIDDALDYLSKLNHETKKARDLYKQLELVLRSDAPKLTAIRRDTPLEYAIRIKEVEERARDGRSEALNAFYGQTVVRERKKPDETKPKDTTTKPESPP